MSLRAVIAQNALHVGRPIRCQLLLAKSNLVLLIGRASIRVDGTVRPIVSQSLVPARKTLTERRDVRASDVIRARMLIQRSIAS